MARIDPGANSKQAKATKAKPEAKPKIERAALARAEEARFLALVNDNPGVSVAKLASLTSANATVSERLRRPPRRRSAVPGSPSSSTTTRRNHAPPTPQIW